MSNQATVGPLTFISRASDVADANGVFWFLEKLQGWGSPAGTLSVTQKPRSHGGWRSESFLTPRTIVLDGTIQAPTSALLAQARHALNAAVSLQDTTFSVTEYGETLSATVTRQGEVIFGDETELWTTFSAQLVAADPLRYGAVLTGSTHMPSTTGGATLPLTLPMTIAATVTTGTIGMFNPGNVSSPLKIRIDGPCPGPIFSDTVDGVQLILSSSYSLSAGSWLDIDTGARTIRENGQASRAGYLLTGSGWPQFSPGNNTFGFNGSGYNSSALASVTAYPGFQ